MQKALAKDVTIRIHSQHDYELVQSTSKFLFGKPSKEDLDQLDEGDFARIFKGVPQAEIEKSVFSEGLGISDALSGQTGFLGSNSEARRALVDKCVKVNTETVDSSYVITEADLIKGKYLLLKKGKKAHYVITAK